VKQSLCIKIDILLFNKDGRQPKGFYIYSILQLPCTSSETGNMYPGNPMSWGIMVCQWESVALAPLL